MIIFFTKRDLSPDYMMEVADSSQTGNTFHAEMIGEMVPKVNKIGDPSIFS